MPEGKMEAAYGQMTAMNDWEAKEFFLSWISEQAKKGKDWGRTVKR
jgi:hypothetical protein